MTGSLVVVGLGPGDLRLVTPEVSAALGVATDIVGYIPYVARVARREGLTVHASDNRAELARARHALADRLHPYRWRWRTTKGLPSAGAQQC